jgi:hypothetical protein
MKNSTNLFNRANEMIAILSKCRVFSVNRLYKKRK